MLVRLFFHGLWMGGRALTYFVMFSGRLISNAGAESSARVVRRGSTRIAMAESTVRIASVRRSAWRVRQREGLVCGAWEDECIVGLVVAQHYGEYAGVTDG